MPTLWLDLETYSEADLSATGAYVYAAHPSTEITLFAYALGDGPVQCWDVTAAPMPSELASALADPAVTLVAHNANFDRTVLEALGYLPRQLGRWQCSMVRALVHALPPGLADLGKALGLPEDQRKLTDGRKLVHKFCKPAPANHKVRRYTRHTSPAEWARFVEYAIQDVAAMRTLWALIPDRNWSPHEIALWRLDQVINDRGFLVDTALAEAGAEAAVKEKESLTVRFRELTRGLIDKPSQRDPLLAYLNAAYHLGLPDLTKDTVTHALKRDLDPVCREILEIRLASNKTSTAKYAALAQAVGADQRFRGGLQFAGAGRTRRFAGRIFQPQNLPSRGLPDARDVALYIDALKAGVHDLLFDDLMRFGAAAIRGLVIAPPGKKLAVADLSNIEGRILAWVAGEDWKLDAFRAYDAGTGPDLYNCTATSIIGGDPWKVSKKDRNVFGKVPDLACVSGDTLVLTKRGLVAIREVSTTDELWDGVEWVHHEGLSDNGVRPVVNVDGIEATPDHLINTQGTWRQAQELATNENILNRALATGSESLRSLASSEALAEASEKLRSLVLADAKRLSSKPISGGGLPPDATTAPSKRPQPHVRSTGVTNIFAPTPSTAGGCSTESRQPLTAAGTLTTEPTRTTVAEVLRSLVSGFKDALNSWRTCSHSKAGTTLRWNSIGSTSTEAMNPATSGSSPVLKTAGTNGLSATCSRESLNSKRVYDLLNAGPRNRFTVKTDSGWLLIHNSGYMGGVPGYQTFAHAYGVRMADYWGVIQRMVDPELVERAQVSASKPHALKQITELEISATEWTACEAVKLAWRARHPATAAFWRNIQTAAIEAVEHPGIVYPCGPVACLGTEIAGRPWLLIKLPSGRYLTYYAPKVVEGDYGPSLTYMSMASEEGGTSRAWIRTYTHGGKLTGNCVQTLAGDLLKDALPLVEHAGFATVLSVHDELVCECDLDRTSDELARLMATPPAWAGGLPLAAAGFETDRYRKD